MKDIVRKIRNSVDNPKEGLPEEIFLLTTELVPMVNVDLLIRDDKGRILLSWRDDDFYGPGWHVPGGIIRLKETLEERIRKTALNEIGTEVIHGNSPIEVLQIIDDKAERRGHFVSLVYECRLTDKMVVLNKGCTKREPGYLEWFETFPEDMIPEHYVYKKYFI